jgi:hypothetical protein
MFGGYDAGGMLPMGVLPDLGTAGLVPARWANRALLFDDAVRYTARLRGEVTIAQTALDALTFGGSAAVTASQLTLWNGDRTLDAIAARGLALERGVAIKTLAAPEPNASDVGSDRDDAVTVFMGRVSSLTPDGWRMQLAVSDLSERLNTALQTVLFDGSGGLLGGANLTGRPQPLSFGWRYNVTPVDLGNVDLGDGALPTYMSHSGSIRGHEAVREKGLAMTQVFVAPSTGQWRDWPSAGCFQLGFSPAGAVTCDVAGSNAPNYTSTHAGIIERLITAYGPALPSADLDAVSFGTVAGQVPGEIGWGVGAEPISTLAAIEQLLASAGIILAGSRAGLLRLAAAPPIAGQVHFTLKEADIVGLRPLALPASLSPAPYAVDVVARRNWTPLTEITASVAPADRSELAGSGRVVRAVSASVSGRQAAKRVLALPSLFRLQVDAQRRAQQYRDWIEPGLKAFEVTFDKYRAQVEIGHVGSIPTYPLFGLSSGFTGIVASWRERPARGQTTVVLIG